jgi:hypothetical protein
MGLPVISPATPSRVAYVSDDRLPPLVDVNVLDNNLLLATASHIRQRFHLCCECTLQPDRVNAAECSAAEGRFQSACCQGTRSVSVEF